MFPFLFSIRKKSFCDFFIYATSAVAEVYQNVRPFQRKEGKHTTRRPLFKVREVFCCSLNSTTVIKTLKIFPGYGKPHASGKN